MIERATGRGAGRWPAIVQGGMGIGVSDWRLARAVARRGQLGVVSGTAIDTLLVRRLQDGDPGGHVRRAMAAFPIAGVADRVRRQYHVPGGRKPGAPYALLSMHRRKVSVARQQVVMLASFVEVFLAREGHEGQVGINLLTKVQLPNLAALYGAMLAGVQHVLMGAGIPREIPAVLDQLALHHPVTLRLDVEDELPGHSAVVEFDPLIHWGVQAPPPVTRPSFLAIVASNSLATMLARKASGRVDGFVVEGPTAGGHNAPPRGPLHLSATGEPVYGPRDVVELSQLGELGLPFWVAGGAGTPEALAAARAAGATGIQVGTLFAYCEESGLAESYKRSVLRHALRGEVTVHTDPLASPTGYPFKVVQWPGDPTAGRPEPRTRKCDIGLLRVAYRRDDGRIGYRCPAEPVEDYLAKGGTLEETVARRCLCNALMADVGFPQVTEDGGLEPPLVTSGDDLMTIGRFLDGREHYAAADVIDYLLAGAQ